MNFIFPFSVGIGGLLSGLMAVAAGKILQAVVYIEDNTRNTALVTRKLMERSAQE